MHQFTSKLYLATLAVALTVALQAGSVDAAPATTDPYLKEIELFGATDLAEARQICATGKMASIQAKLRADKELKRFDLPLPPVENYCLKVLTVSVAQARMADLYVNMALQEQGFESYDTVGQVKLLSHGEASRTTLAILTSANAGQPTYTSITGKSRDLPCPLALDTGATWAAGNDKATLPIDLTEAEVSAIARQCYAPATTTITVRGVVTPAQKAGLIAGVWLAKQ